MNPRLKELVIFVEDMNKQVTFYRDKLGLSLTYPIDIKDFSKQYWVTFDTGQCTLALHGGGNKNTSKNGPKFVFEVENLDSARKELEARGIKLTETRCPAPGVYVCDGSDPEGNAFSVEGTSSQ